MPDPESELASRSAHELLAILRSDYTSEVRYREVENEIRRRLSNDVDQIVNALEITGPTDDEDEEEEDEEDETAAYLQHQQRHQRLHNALDELAADWISQDPEPYGPNRRSIMKRSIFDLMVWSNEQRKNPTEPRR